MSRRLMTILLVALIVATGASYLVYRIVRTRMTTNAAAATVSVIVAKRNLEVGTMIADADVGLGPWVGSLPKGVVTRKEDALGRGVVSNVYAGEPIFDARLAQPGAGAGLAATIPSGMRATAVRVNDVVGVAGFVLPGMRVDVLITGTPPGAPTTQGPHVKTLLQNVEVLSAGTNITKDAKGTPVQVPVVNLLVTPEQAETLSLASNETRIQLVLRNPLDREEAKTDGSTVSGLFTGVKKAPQETVAPQARRTAAAVRPPPKPPAKAAAPLPPGQYVIEVINGPRKEQSKFAKPDEEKLAKPEEARP